MKEPHALALQVTDQSTPAEVELPVAWNVCDFATAMEAVAGATTIKPASVTVSAAEPVIPPMVAVMLEVAGATPVANPPGAMVATSVWAELHVTKGVRTCVLPLVRWPVATNCCVFPAETEVCAGVTLMELSSGSLPVPLSATRIGLPNALSLIVSVPWRKPTEVGVNVTPIVHLSPGLMLEPQVSLATVKSPLGTTEEMSNLVLRSLVSVTVWEGLVVPTRRLTNVWLAGATATAAIAVPLRAID